jgi:hypothetical protein
LQEAHGAEEESFEFVFRHKQFKVRVLEDGREDQHVAELPVIVWVSFI